MDGSIKNDLNIGVIIQARMSSDRLPGKILLKLPFGSEYTLIEQIIFRVKSIGFKVIVATSVNKENDVLEEIAKRNDVYLFRGSEEDVLSRFYNAAILYKLDIIVRLTADNPCIDPGILDKTIKTHLKNNADYTKTTGLPLGLNIEVLSFGALKKTYENAILDEDREHVTSFIFRNSDEFKINIIPFDVELPNVRLTVDYALDYAFVCYIYESLFIKDRFFGLEEVLSLLKRNQWALLINKDMIQHSITSDNKKI